MKGATGHGVTTWKRPRWDRHVPEAGVELGPGTINNTVLSAGTANSGRIKKSQWQKPSDTVALQNSVALSRTLLLRSRESDLITRILFANETRLSGRITSSSPLKHASPSGDNSTGRRADRVVSLVVVV